jgi:hypothetical protein
MLELAAAHEHVRYRNLIFNPGATLSRPYRREPADIPPA